MPHIKSLSDCHYDRLLAPAALACFLVWCGTCASRMFHTTHYIVCAAKPREHPAREGEDSENQTLTNRSG